MLPFITLFGSRVNKWPCGKALNNSSDRSLAVAALILP